MRANDVVLWTDHNLNKWVRYEYHDKGEGGYQIEIKNCKIGYIQKSDNEGLHFLDVIEGDDLMKIREEGEKIIMSLQEEYIENMQDFGIYE